jgi:hypothetical protein
VTVLIGGNVGSGETLPIASGNTDISFIVFSGGTIIAESGGAAELTVVSLGGFWLRRSVRWSRAQHCMAALALGA